MQTFSRDISGPDPVFPEAHVASAGSAARTEQQDHAVLHSCPGTQQQRQPVLHANQADANETPGASGYPGPAHGIFNSNPRGPVNVTLVGSRVPTDVKAER